MIYFLWFICACIQNRFCWPWNFIGSCGPCPDLQAREARTWRLFWRPWRPLTAYDNIHQQCIWFRCIRCFAELNLLPDYTLVSKVEDADFARVLQKLDLFYRTVASMLFGEYSTENFPSPSAWDLGVWSWEPLCRDRGQQPMSIWNGRQIVRLWSVPAGWRNLRLRAHRNRASLPATVPSSHPADLVPLAQFRNTLMTWIAIVETVFFEDLLEGN